MSKILVEFHIRLARHSLETDWRTSTRQPRELQKGKHESAELAWDLVGELIRGLKAATNSHWVVLLFVNTDPIAISSELVPLVNFGGAYTYVTSDTGDSVVIRIDKRCSALQGFHRLTRYLKHPSVLEVWNK